MNKCQGDFLLHGRTDTVKKKTKLKKNQIYFESN